MKDSVDRLPALSASEQALPGSISSSTRSGAVDVADVAGLSPQLFWCHVRQRARDGLTFAQ